MSKRALVAVVLASAALVAYGCGGSSESPSATADRCDPASTELILVGDDGGLVALDQRGMELWRLADGSRAEDLAMLPAGDRAGVPGMLPAGDLVVTTTGEAVTIRDARDGEVVAEVTGDQVDVGRGCEVLVSGDGLVSLVEPDGTVRWQRNGGSAVFAGVTTEVIQVGKDGDPSAEIWSVDDGSVLWTLDDGFDEVAANGSDYLISQDENDFNTYYDLVTGEVLWAASGEGRLGTVGRSGFSAYLLESGGDTDLISVVDDRNGGKLAWQRIVGGRDEVTGTAAGSIVLIDPNSNLVVFRDHSTGVESAFIPLPCDGGSVHAAELDDGTIVVGVCDALYGIGPEGEVLWERALEDGIDWMRADEVAAVVLMDGTVVLDAAGETVLDVPYRLYFQPLHSAIPVHLDGEVVAVDPRTGEELWTIEG